MPGDKELAASQEYCRRVARAAARNFYYGFALLPPAKRDALCALYAFMRRADDISDSDLALNYKIEGLKAWRHKLDKALSGDYGDSPILPAFHHTVSEYRIPAAYYHDLI